MITHHEIEHRVFHKILIYLSVIASVALSLIQDKESHMWYTRIIDATLCQSADK